LKTVRVTVAQASELRVNENPLRGCNTVRICGSARHLRAGSVGEIPFYLNSTRTTSTSFVRLDAGSWMVSVWFA